MDTTRSGSRSRYTTTLPFPLETLNQEVPRQAKRSTSYHKTEDLPRATKPGKAHSRSNVVTHRRRGSFESQGVWSTGPSLPYPRVLQGHESRRRATDASPAYAETNSGSDQTSRSTESTMVTPPIHDGHLKRIRIVDFDSSTGEASQPSRSTSPKEHSTSPIGYPAYAKDVEYDVTHTKSDTRTGLEEMPPAQQLPTPSIPVRSSKRPKTTSSNDSWCDLNHRGTSVPLGSTSETPRWRAGATFERLRSLIPSIPAHHTSWRSQRSEPSSSTDERPPTPRYEVVEGVSLDAQPVATKQKRMGLPIPEIEAQDVRRLPSPTRYSNGVVPNAPEHGAATMYFAESSSQCNDVQRQSGLQPGIGVSVENPVPSEPSHGPTSLSSEAARSNELLEDTQRFRNHLVARAVRPVRHSRSSSRRDQPFSVPTLIPEVSREDLLDAPGSQEKDPAQPPPIALTGKVEETEAPFRRGLHAAKSIVSGIF